MLRGFGVVDSKKLVPSGDITVEHGPFVVYLCHMHKYIYIYTYIYLHIYIYTHAHIYIYIHTYTQTHTHIYIYIYPSIDPPKLNGFQKGFNPPKQSGG